MTPDEIESSRPPDRVVWTEWMPVHEDNPPSRQRTFATRTSLFKVLESETITEYHRLERRTRQEFWDIPARGAEVLVENIGPATVDGGEDVVFSYTAPSSRQTVGRATFEERRRWSTEL